MHARTSTFVLLLATAVAQEAQRPAPELQKLASFVGTWSGAGTLHEPGGVLRKWTGSGTCAWCLGGHFLQEDWQIAFEGMPAPKVMHARLGWDRVRKCYVNAFVGNDGEVALEEFELLADGTRVQTMVKHQGGASYALRSRFKVTGDTLEHTVDLLPPDADSQQIVEGAFTRGGKAFAGSFDGPTWMGAKPHESLARLGRSAGAYESSGTMRAMPGGPPTAFRGTETFRNVFGDTVLCGHTEGGIEGAPATYVGDVFWGYDARRDCLVGVYVSNMGDVLPMESRWSPEGKLVTTSTPLFLGQPAMQRMVMEFDAAGAAKSAVGDRLVGTSPPEQFFQVSYTKKK